MSGFWRRAKSVRVTWQRGDPRLRDLAASFGDVPGVYALELSGRIMRVGMSRQLGDRLLHHLSGALVLRESERPRRDPAHFEFHRALLGRELTIRYLACPLERCRALEQTTIAQAPEAYSGSQSRSSGGRRIRSVEL